MGKRAGAVPPAARRICLDPADPPLAVAERTVNGHVTSIYSKLGVHTRAAAVREAAAHGLV